MGLGYCRARAVGYRHLPDRGTGAVAAPGGRGVRQGAARQAADKALTTAVGLVHRPGIGIDQTARAGRHPVAALPDHPRHTRRGRRGHRARGGAGVPLRRRLAHRPGALRPGARLPGADVGDDHPIRQQDHPGTQVGRTDERGGGRLPRGPAGRPHLRRRRIVEFPHSARRLHRLPRRLATPVRRQENPDGSGHQADDVPVADHGRGHPAGRRRCARPRRSAAIPVAGHDVRRAPAGYRLWVGRHPGRHARRATGAERARRTRADRPRGPRDRCRRRSADGGLRPSELRLPSRSSGDQGRLADPGTRDGHRPGRSVGLG